MKLMLDPLYGDVAQRIVPDAFRKQPLLRSWYMMFAQRLQRVEFVVYDMVFERFLDSARGVHLDWLGEMVGYKRNGLSDGAYRRFLYAKSLANSFDGNAKLHGPVESITQIMAALVGVESVRYMLYPFRQFTFEYVRPNPTTSTERDLIRAFMEKFCVPPGAMLMPIVEAVPTAVYFSAPEDVVPWPDSAFLAEVY